MSVLSKFIYAFNVIPIKILEGFIVNIEKLVLKFMQNGKANRIAKLNLKKKNKIVAIILQDFKAYYKSTAIRILWYLQRETRIDGNEWKNWSKSCII